MTTTDALTILRLTSTIDTAGHVVRDADERGDHEDLTECEQAAKLLGLALEEDFDGDLVIAACWRENT